MSCKDSDVFALEGSIDKILSKGGSKGIKEIKKELRACNEKDYNHWIKRRLATEEEVSEELFYSELMDRICSLFPMKYMRTEEDKYARTLSHNDV